MIFIVGLTEAAMILCLCEGVSDRTIRAVARDGADSVREVGRRCGAGTGCGMCRRDIRAVLDAELPRRETETSLVLSK
jgi:bacterioferritin-associated ferredoxin